MLLEFSVENYRSFRDRQTLSMAPDEGKKEEAGHTIEADGKYKALRSAIIYGANASGKSNLMKAMQALRNLVLSPADRAPDKAFEEYEPFLFNPRAASAPASFELDFLLEAVRYNYKVSILRERVVEEQLLFYPEGREAKLFRRVGQEFEFGDFLKGQKVIVSRLTGDNQLFLSKAARNNIAQLVKVYQFFAGDYMPIPFLDSWVDSYYLRRIARELEKEKKNGRFISNFKTLLKSFDTGIIDFQIEKPELPSLENEYEISVEHLVFDDGGKEAGTTLYPLAEESSGTQKLFVLGGLILRALMDGRVIIVDEFERSLHPLICSYLIQLFHDPKINNKGTQLLLATHDTNLLSSVNFRRDQVWIIEKDQAGASELYSLAEIKGILKGAPYEKWYLSGRLGGIPGIRSLDFELNYATDEKE